MDEQDIKSELNKILTLEHGHLGMYKNYTHYKDKDIRRTFRRFMEIEIEHIEKLKNISRNIGFEPTLLIETGDIIGKFFNISINLTNEQEMIKAYSFIENKSHEGYKKFVKKLENDTEKRNNFLAEFVVSNMLEAKLMELWLKDKLTSI